jgi:hypothetical protein
MATQHRPVHRQIAEVVKHPEAEGQTKRAHNEPAHQQRAPTNSAKENGLIQIWQNEVRFASALVRLLRQQRYREQKSQQK